MEISFFECAIFILKTLFAFVPEAGLYARIFLVLELAYMYAHLFSSGPGLYARIVLVLNLD